MRSLVINKLMNLIKNNNLKYDDNNLLEIKYGLESLYILITKSIVIMGIALLLGIIKELLIFTLFYNFIKLPSFGAHAGKSWICLLSSLLLFIGLPLIGSIISFPLEVRSLLGCLGIISMFAYAPAATKKHPIVNHKRIITLKYISTILAIIFVIIAITINNYFISINLILSLLLQGFIVSPLAKKLFHQSL